MNPRLSLVIALMAGSAGALSAMWPVRGPADRVASVSETLAPLEGQAVRGGALRFPGAGASPTGLAVISAGPSGDLHMDLPGPALDLQLEADGKATVRHGALERTLTLQTTGVWMDGDRLDTGGATLTQGCGAASGRAPGDESCGTRLEVASGTVTAWFEGESDALMQGWDVVAPADGEAMELRIAVATDDGIVSVVDDLLTVQTQHGDWQGDRIRAWDAEQRPLDIVAEPADGGFTLRVDTVDAAWPVHVDPSWSAVGSLPLGDGFHPSALSAGDVNGDGILDVIFGHAGAEYDDGQGNPLVAAGRIGVVLGEEGGFDTEVSQTLFSSSPVADARFGGVIASGGDIDGDGYDDVVVGAPRHGVTLSRQGRIEVYLGSSSGLPSTPDTTIDGSVIDGLFGSAITFVGDVDGDGYDDVAVSAPEDGTGKVELYLGSATGLSTTPEQTWTSNTTAYGGSFGDTLLGGMDINGDGEPDLVVGEPLHVVSASTGNLANAGRIHVFQGTGSGLPATADDTIEGAEENALLGWSLGNAGDLDDDGYDDVAVNYFLERSSWPLYDDEFSMEPKLAIYSGSSSGLSLDVTLGTDDQVGSVWNGDVHADFGLASVSPGDVDGDGYDDLVVAAPNLTHQAGLEGRLYLYKGGASGVDSEVEHVWDGMVRGANLGRILLAPGDLDGDGLADVMATGFRGVRWFAGEEAYESPDVTGDLLYAVQDHDVYFLNQTFCGGNSTTACGPDDLYLNFERSRFGNHVRGIGDVDGDGYDDIAVSAPNEACGSYGGQFGAVHVHLGSADGVEATEHAWLCGDNPGDYFGLVVDGGDVNGDGYDDLLVGSYSDYGEQVQVYHGSATGLSSTADATLSKSLINDFGWDAAIVGDIDGDGYDDVVVGYPDWGTSSSDWRAGRFEVYLGSSTGISTTASATFDGTVPLSSMGSTVRGVGDIDGDGYDDVAVGAPLHKDGDDIVGRVYLYLGDANGLQSPAAWTFDGQVDGPRVGIHIDGGDLDGDGYADLVLGEQPHDDNLGELEPVDTRALVFWGDALGPAATPDVTLSPDVWDSGHGVNVVITDDVDGDGHAELMLGVPGARRADKPKVVIHAADGTGIDVMPSWVSETWMTPIWTHGDESRFGLSPRHSVKSGSLASAGDIDGDGYGDLIFGLRAAPWPASRASYVTRVIYGSASGVLDELGPSESISVEIAGNTTVEIGEALSLTATGTHSGDEDLAYVWSFGDGTQAEGTSVTHTWSEDGVYTVVVTATDDVGHWNEAELTLTVSAADADADGLPDDWETEMGLDATQANASDDPDADGRSNAEEYADGTDPLAYEGPVAPMLLVPDDDEELTTLSPALSWQPVAHPRGLAQTFQVRIATQADLSPVVWDETGLTGSTWVADPALQENAELYWAVRAVDADVASPWSEVRAMFLNATEEPPSVPEPAYPAEGDVMAQAGALLQWVASVDPDGDAISYEVELWDGASAEALAWTVDGAVGPMVSTEPIGEPAEDALVDWRVRAVDEHGEASEWSELASFVHSDVDGAPTTPSLQWPLDGEQGVEHSPTVRALPGVDPEGTYVRHVLQLDSAATFRRDERIELVTNPLDGAAEEVVWDLWSEGVELTDRTDWYLRAQAIDATGMRSPWDMVKVRVGGPDLPPEVPVLVGPAHGTRVRLGEPLAFEVQTPADPDGDEVQIEVALFADADMTDPLGQAVVVGDLDVVAVELALPEGHRELWWSARAVDATGLEGDWAEAQRLKVRGPGSSAGCSTVPGAAGSLGLGLLLFGVRRRRR